MSGPVARLRRVIAAGRGDAPANLVLHGGRVAAEDDRPTVPVRRALATSGSHDAPNFMVAGADERGMPVVVQGGRALARLALSVAGLVTEEPLPRVAAQMDALIRMTRRLGGCVCRIPS